MFTTDTIAPCIMCVQYRGGCSVPWGVQYRGGIHEYRGGIHEYRGGYLEYHGGVQYRGGYHDKCGDILSTVGVFSTVGDIMSTVEGVQYRGGKIFCYLSTPHGTHDIPHMYHDILHGTEHPPRYS